jgi:hypothetical protein
LSLPPPDFRNPPTNHYTTRLGWHLSHRLRVRRPPAT